jgi:TonB family protein
MPMQPRGATITLGLEGLMPQPTAPIPSYRNGDSRWTLPAVIEKVDPVYTKQGLEAKFEGLVAFSLTVRTDGLADNITVLRGVGLGLDEKAVECQEKWRFRPATRDGEPVPVRVTVEINFRLPQN